MLTMNAIVSCCYAALKTGQISVIFTTPEALQNEKLTTIVRHYRERVCLVAFDEVHCMSEWYFEHNIILQHNTANAQQSIVSKHVD